MRHLIALTTLLLLAGCTGGSGTADSAGSGGSSAAVTDTSATVQEAGAFKVSQLEWDAELLSIPERARARYQNEKGKNDIAERILLNKALYARAEAAGVTKDDTVRVAAELAAQKSYVTALLAKVEKDAATDEAVLAHYNENKEKYQRPMVRARHILVKDEALANDISGQLAAGGDFAALAREHSEDRGSKAKGGELPWATRDRWVPEFAEAAFATDVGSTTKPIKTKFGYHIIEVLEKREMQPLEEVRPGIERVLTRNAVRDYREGVRKELGFTNARAGAVGAGGPATDAAKKKAVEASSKAKKRDPKAPPIGEEPAEVEGAEGGEGAEDE